jgi:hypothetical protein
VGWDWVHLVLRPLFGLLYQLQVIDHDDDDCGEIGGMKIGGEAEVLGEKTYSGATLSTTNPTRPDPARTRAAAVGSLRLTVPELYGPAKAYC